ncbi:MAG: butyryl-CoA:acetate CoA-transferase, partial [Dehalococcoidia bacterium]
MDWIEHYQKSLVSADEAVQIVKSGDTVVLDTYVSSFLINALAARKDELQNIRVLTHCPLEDQDWLQEGYQETFNVVVMNYLGEMARPAYDKKLIDYYPMILSLG